MKLFHDTTPKMRRVYEETLRRRSPEESFRMAQQLTFFVQRISFIGERDRHPELSDDDIWLRLAVQRFRSDVPVRPTMPADPFLHAPQISAILDSLDIRYVVAGAVAAMIYGEARSTLNLDVMIEADERQLELLIARLEPEYYVRAVRADGFQVLHGASATTINFFLAEDRDDVRVQFERRRWFGEPAVAFYAPEDIIIRKLLCGETETHWRDIMGIMRIRREPLDEVYLERAAASFGVTDLLTRARQDAATL